MTDDVKFYVGLAALVATLGVVSWFTYVEQRKLKKLEIFLDAEKRIAEAKPVAEVKS